MFPNFKCEFFENPSTDFLKNFANIFLIDRIHLGLQKSTLSVRIVVETNTLNLLKVLVYVLSRKGH